MQPQAGLKKQQIMKVDQDWFNHYPTPTLVNFDQGCEFTSKEFQNLLMSYGVNSRPRTACNPQSNGEVKRVHKTVYNMLWTFDQQVWKFEPIKPWAGFLYLVAFGIWSTYHATLKATPKELVFKHDMIFERAFTPDWGKIQE